MNKQNSFILNFAHEEPLSLLCFYNKLFCGIGGSVYVYNERSILTKTAFFFKQKIHIIKSANVAECNFICVAGGKMLAVALWDVSCNELKTVGKKICSDWILDVQINANVNQLILVTSHNEAQQWSVNPLRFLKKTLPQIGSCILYSATIFVDDDKILVFAGTVFSEIIVWNPNFHNTSSPIVRYLKGHKGVIFSIAVQKCENNQFIVCSTSDDRSCLLTRGFLECDEWQQLPPLYSHTARVWKCLLLPNYFLTAGEDSAICSWNYDGVLLNRITLHANAGIRSLQLANRNIVAGASDGSLFKISKKQFNEESSSPLLLKGHINGPPRKVALFGVSGVACVTRTHLNYKMTRDDPFTCIEHELLRNSTDLKASRCGSLIAVSTVCGYIILVDGETSKMSVTKISDYAMCQSIFWHESLLLVQTNTGEAYLLSVKNANCVLSISVLLMPKSKETAATCFVRLPQEKLVLGDRCGHLHLFFKGEKIVQCTLPKVHSHLGVFDIIYQPQSDSVISVGAGGWVKETRVVSNSLVAIRCFAVPMESAVRILSISDRILIAGFHGSSLLLWTNVNKMIVARHKCGGGHRSFDFQVNESKDVNFIYIKDKKIFQIHFCVDSVNEIRQGYHSKVINSLQPAGKFIITGSDDNTVKVATFDEDRLKVLETFEHHCSTVRAVKIVDVANDGFLIISAGGREQLSLTEINANTGMCQKAIKHLTSSDDGFPDSRYMCVDTISSKSDSDFFFIFVGCSDCKLRLFTYKNGVFELFTSVQYTHCILQVIAHDNHVVTFATDGKAVFWDVKEIAEKFTALPRHSIQLHQSGINSALISSDVNAAESPSSNYFLITGGDDNKMCVAKIASATCQVQFLWSSDSVHSSQITGLAVYGDWLLSASIDQRIVLHRLKSQSANEELVVGCIAETQVTVADVQGLSILSANPSQLKVCVYGSGIQVITVNLPDATQDLDLR